MSEEGKVYTKKDAQDMGILAIPLSSELNNEVIIYDIKTVEDTNGLKGILTIRVEPEESKKEAYTYGQYIVNFVLMLKEKGLFPYKALLVKKGNAYLLD